MSVLRDLAAFVCGASVTSLPEAERAIQRRHAADTLLAAAVGAWTGEGRELRYVMSASSLADAIGMQAAVVRHTEIDDIHTPSCTTPSSVTVPTAFALARAREISDPAQVASALWVGTELLVRLGVTIDGARVLYRGVWPTYFCAPFAAAAIAARIGSLSEDATAHALSLALMRTAGRSGRFHGRIPGRSVILGMAVADGVRAAQAAREGVGGDPDLLDGTWLHDAHGLDADPKALTADLGRGSIYAQLSLKPFCSAKQAVAATEALMTVIDGGVAPDTIDKVTVRVPPPYARMIATKPEAGARSSTIVSAAYQLGLAAFRRERLYDIERASAMQEPAVLAFAGKVEVVPDESLLVDFPAHFPAEIEVSTKGTTVRKRVTAAYGDPSRPLDDAALKDKADRIFTQAGGTRAGSDLIALGLAGLKDRESCKAVAKAFASTPAAVEMLFAQ
jgi:2-methylcitrate dehydratase PrpD